MLGKISDLETKLTTLGDEKTTNESQLNETISTVKRDHEATRLELQTEVDELNARGTPTSVCFPAVSSLSAEHKAHQDLHQREARFDQQVADYEDKLQQAHLKWEQLHTQWNTLHAEKLQSDETIAALQHDLTTMKNDLQSQSRMIFSGFFHLYCPFVR